MILYKTTSTVDDFVRAEVEEHGWDYVDEKFALGYEPMAPKGFWCWMKPYAVEASNSSNTLNLRPAQTTNNSPRRVIVRN